MAPGGNAIAQRLDQLGGGFARLVVGFGAALARFLPQCSELALKRGNLRRQRAFAMFSVVPESGGHGLPLRSNRKINAREGGRFRAAASCLCGDFA